MWDSKRDTDVQNSLLDSVGEGEGGMIWENGIGTNNIIYETSRQSRFDARYWMLGAGALGRPRGMVPGGRRTGGSGWGTHVYLWQIHVDIWQNRYNIVKLKNKIKKKWSAILLTQFAVCKVHYALLFMSHWDLLNMFIIYTFNL